jgi:hypothetical protein
MGVGCKETTETWGVDNHDGNLGFDGFDGDVGNVGSWVSLLL